MSEVDAFSIFVARALTPNRASRYSTLTGSAKGRKRLLGMLYHDFEKSMRQNVKRGNVNRALPCYAYHSSLGFGKEFPSVVNAYKQLCDTDSWLIVVSDGSAGIYRPEDHWDAEVEIVS